MAAVENSEPSSPPLELTVLEYEAGTVHVRLKERIDASLVQPGSLADHLAANSGTSGRVCLYYVVPVPVPFGTVMPIDDAVSAAVFFEWFRRNVTDVFAVVVNDATSDFEKVRRILRSPPPPLTHPLIVARTSTTVVFINT